VTKETSCVETVLNGLKAAAEPTRLRLLALLAQGELAVSEITHILGQSQPRVSRHLKLLCEAGLLDRFPEGAWVFHRVAARGHGARLARALLALLPGDDPRLAADRLRLDQVRAARAARAATYFRDNAAHWDEIRSLHVDEAEVERAVLALLGRRRRRLLIDMGTGTGRILSLLSPHVERAIGYDLSHEMLSLARANLDRAGLDHCMVRQGDIAHLPLPSGEADLVTLYQVLHYAADPAAVMAETARVLQPGGEAVVVDFAPHQCESLRDQHAHRRLGFSETEVADWLAAAGLIADPPQSLPGHPLTVTIWRARKPDALVAVAAPQPAGALA
jgi:ubiquinone/menaquinone biosynthesis C-methylase UbiE